MAERLLAPSAIRAVYEYLDSVMDVPAAGRLPENHKTAGEFIRVRGGGGSEIDVARVRPTIFVESYAGLVQRAEEIALEADSWLMKAALEGWLLAVPVLNVSVISRPQELPDPLTQQARFTATYAPILRRSAA